MSPERFRPTPEVSPSPHNSSFQSEKPVSEKTEGLPYNLRTAKGKFMAYIYGPFKPGENPEYEQQSRETRRRLLNNASQEFDKLARTQGRTVFDDQLYTTKDYIKYREKILKKHPWYDEEGLRFDYKRKWYAQQAKVLPDQDIKRS